MSVDVDQWGRSIMFCVHDIFVGVNFGRVIVIFVSLPLTVKFSLVQLLQDFVLRHFARRFSTEIHDLKSGASESGADGGEILK